VELEGLKGPEAAGGSNTTLIQIASSCRSNLGSFSRAEMQRADLSGVDLDEQQTALFHKTFEDRISDIQSYS